MGTSGALVTTPLIKAVDASFYHSQSTVGSISSISKYCQMGVDCCHAFSLEFLLPVFPGWNLFSLSFVNQSVVISSFM